MNRLANLMNVLGITSADFMSNIFLLNALLFSSKPNNYEAELILLTSVNAKCRICTKVV